MLVGLVLVVGVLAITGCGVSSEAGRANTPPATVAATPTPSGLTGYPVKVYFSRYPDSMAATNPPNPVFAVNRVSPTTQVEEFSLQLLIAGPTPEERAQGYFTELNDAFSGSSNCAGALPVDGPDFTLRLNMKGTTPEQGTATLQFCRPMTLAGDLVDGRLQAEIDATLLQFATVKKVVILTDHGDCFGLRGGSWCLQ
ncbi:MAG TPA: hypothetical protein VGF38_21105 [Ktedonobacterales bacterium]